MENSDDNVSLMCVDFGRIAQRLSSFGQMIGCQVLVGEETAGGLQRNEEFERSTESPNLLDVASSRETNNKSEREPIGLVECFGNFAKFVKDEGLNSILRVFQPKNPVSSVPKLKYPIQVSDGAEEPMEDGKSSDVDAFQELASLESKALPDSSDTYRGRLDSFQNFEFEQRHKRDLARCGYSYHLGQIKCVECHTVNKWRPELGSPIPRQHRSNCRFNTVPPLRQKAVSELGREHLGGEVARREDQGACSLPKLPTQQDEEKRKGVATLRANRRKEEGQSIATEDEILASTARQPVNAGHQQRPKIAQKRKAT